MIVTRGGSGRAANPLTAPLAGPAGPAKTEGLRCTSARVRLPHGGIAAWNRSGHRPSGDGPRAGSLAPYPTGDRDGRRWRPLS